jgi:DNA helicase-2/ATP-dependent DNA helicase PcrA
MSKGFDFQMLNHQQREAVGTIEGPVLILAGAGTGKTRVITARISHMISTGIAPENILAVTFTNKAANEMRERVRGMLPGGEGSKVVLGTFHAFCVRLLREHAEHLGYKRNFTIYSQAEQLAVIKRVLPSLLGKEESLDPSVALSRVSATKNSPETAGDPEESLDAAVAQRYQEELVSLNAMDFDDLLILGVRLLEEHAEVREQVQQRHRYVMVDEFQDTNSTQMRLLRALVPPPHHVCVVGDDDQSIYGWRGAEITNITEFERFFPNPHVIKLEENYRSTTPILHTANSLIRHNAGRRPKSLWSRNPGRDRIRLIATQDDKEEAGMVAKEIENAHFTEGASFDDFAVLFRTNDQSRVLEQEFRQRRIPYRVVGARSFFDRREVKDILSYLRMLLNPHDDAALSRILNTPTRGIGKGAIGVVREHSIENGCSLWVSLCADDLRRQLPARAREAVADFTALVDRFSESAHTKGTQLRRMTEQLIHEVNYMDHLKKAAKEPEDYASWETGLKDLLENIDAYDQRDRSGGLAGFIDEVSLNDDREDKDDIEKKSGVCLITMHASKGLEFPVVYLPGVEQGILPHKRSHDEGRVDEERRLFYVGITRAKQKLTLSWARFRMKWGQKQTSLPSPFLRELDREYVDEVDYSRHMKQPIAKEEHASFFAGLKSMLATEGEEP